MITNIANTGYEALAAGLLAAFSAQILKFIIFTLKTKKINFKIYHLLTKKYYNLKLEKLFTICDMFVETPPKNSLTNELALIKEYIPPI